MGDLETDVQLAVAMASRDLGWTVEDRLQEIRRASEALLLRYNHPKTTQEEQARIEAQWAVFEQEARALLDQLRYAGSTLDSVSSLDGAEHFARGENGYSN